MVLHPWCTPSRVEFRLYSNMYRLCAPHASKGIFLFRKMSFNLTSHGLKNPCLGTKFLVFLDQGFRPKSLSFLDSLSLSLPLVFSNFRALIFSNKITKIFNFHKTKINLLGICGSLRMV